MRCLHPTLTSHPLFAHALPALPVITRLCPCPPPKVQPSLGSSLHKRKEFFRPQSGPPEAAMGEATSEGTAGENWWRISEGLHPVQREQLKAIANNQRAADLPFRPRTRASTSHFSRWAIFTLGCLYLLALSSPSSVFPPSSQESTTHEGVYKQRRGREIGRPGGNHRDRIINTDTSCIRYTTHQSNPSI